MGGQRHEVENGPSDLLRGGESKISGYFFLKKDTSMLPLGEDASCHQDLGEKKKKVIRCSPQKRGLKKL